MIIEHPLPVIMRLDNKLKLLRGGHLVGNNSIQTLDDASGFSNGSNQLFQLDIWDGHFAGNVGKARFFKFDLSDSDCSVCRGLPMELMLQYADRTNDLKTRMGSPSIQKELGLLSSEDKCAALTLIRDMTRSSIVKNQGGRSKTIAIANKLLTDFDDISLERRIVALLQVGIFEAAGGFHAPLPARYRHFLKNPEALLTGAGKEFLNHMTLVAMLGPELDFFSNASIEALAQLHDESLCQTADKFLVSLDSFTLQTKPERDEVLRFLLANDSSTNPDLGVEIAKRFLDDLTILNNYGVHNVQRLYQRANEVIFPGVNRNNPSVDLNNYKRAMNPEAKKARHNLAGLFFEARVPVNLFRRGFKPLAVEVFKRGELKIALSGKTAINIEEAIRRKIVTTREVFGDFYLFEILKEAREEGLIPYPDSEDFYMQLSSGRRVRLDVDLVLKGDSKHSNNLYFCELKTNGKALWESENDNEQISAFIKLAGEYNALPVVIINTSNYVFSDGCLQFKNRDIEFIERAQIKQVLAKHPKLILWDENGKEITSNFA